MANMPLPQVEEIDEVIFALECFLKRLDDMGTGIAAIHVDAAIQQLKQNVSFVSSGTITSYDPELLCIEKIALKSSS